MRRSLVRALYAARVSILFFNLFGAALKTIKHSFGRFVLNCLTSKEIAMKTVNDLIKELQKLNPKQQNLPFVLYDTEHNHEYSLDNLDSSSGEKIYLNLMY